VADLTEPPGASQDEVLGRHAVKSTRSPGWYALGENPNEQSYWDGAKWAGVRHWVAGRGWIESAGVPAAASAAATTDGPPAKERFSAGPPAQSLWPSHTVTGSSAPTTLSIGVLLTMISGVALMVGSVNEWIHVNGVLGIVDFHATVIGIDQSVTNLIGVNGWATFIGGIVLLVLGGLSLSSEEVLLAVLTTIVAFVVAIFAIYEMFRVVQKISQLPGAVGPSVNVGWGLICVLAAAAVALLVSLSRLVRRG